MAAAKQDLVALAIRSAQKAGIDPAITPVFLGLIEQESNWNPKARSSVGATGLGQLMPDTARELGVKDVTDPAQNLDGAARYFKQQLDTFGDVGIALAAYNWGPGNARKMINNPRSVRIPKETQNYIPSVLKKSTNYGAPPAPSNATLAFFPDSADVAKVAVDKSVNLRTGAGAPEEIRTTLAAGKQPTGEPVTAPSPGGAQMPGMSEMMIAAGPTAGGTEVMGAEALLGGPPIAAGPATPTSEIGMVRSFDDFLRSKFGPLATVADPFPKGYDDKLMSLIEQA